MQPVSFFRDRAGARSNSTWPDRTGRSTGMSHQGIFSSRIIHSFCCMVAMTCQDKWHDPYTIPYTTVILGTDILTGHSIPDERYSPVYGRNIGHRNTDRHSIKIDPYTTVLTEHSVLCYNVSINTGLYYVKIKSYIDLFYWSDGPYFCAQCYGRIQDRTVHPRFIRLSWRTRYIPSMCSSKYMMDYAN